MTRVEAVERLKSIKSLVDKYDDVVALREAIKAVEQEPCDVSDTDVGKIDAVSRQAVLDALRTMYDTHIVETEDGDEYIDYNDTIYEIEQLPSVTPKAEPCNDAISRQAVQTELNNCEVVNVRDENDNFIGYYNADTVDSIVRNLSSVNPQPKTGHWEWEQYYYYPKRGNWHCSECKCVVIECVDKNEKGGIPLYKYCPQCGAKMVEPQESDDNEDIPMEYFESGGLLRYE